MKTLLTLVITLLFTLTANAAELSCDNKIASIETEILHAKEHNNKNKIKGLEKALKNTKANCTDAKLLQEKNKKLRDKEQDVEKAKQELNKAKSQGKSDKKIKKKQRKLDEQLKELEEEKS